LQMEEEGARSSSGDGGGDGSSWFGRPCLSAGRSCYGWDGVLNGLQACWGRFRTRERRLGDGLTMTCSTTDGLGIDEERRGETTFIFLSSLL
jgi:hypothetical protein